MRKYPETARLVDFISSIWWVLTFDHATISLANWLSSWITEFSATKSGRSIPRAYLKKITGLSQRTDIKSQNSTNSIRAQQGLQPIAQMNFQLKQSDSGSHTWRISSNINVGFEIKNFALPPCFWLNLHGFEKKWHAFLEPWLRARFTLFNTARPKTNGEY